MNRITNSIFASSRLCKSTCPPRNNCSNLLRNGVYTRAWISSSFKPAAYPSTSAPISSVAQAVVPPPAAAKTTVEDVKVSEKEKDLPGLLILLSFVMTSFKSSLTVTFEDVSRALYRIQSGIKRTHCDLSKYLSEICGCNIYLKKDFTQFTGSFKERSACINICALFLTSKFIGRGGRNALMLLSPEAKKKGVITASAGNHALALAWHGKDLGIPVICVMYSELVRP